MNDAASRVRPSLLVQALREPAAAARWPLPRWDALVRQARKSDLLARLAHAIADAGASEIVHPAPRAHLDAALVVERAEHEDVRREVRHVAQALAAVGVDTVVLKGGAYVVAGHAAARGRTLSDIDVLVPREALAQVESSLMLNGWAGSHHSAYDQRYYREWMHELPPMQHIRRGTVLDVHHAILPLTARRRPDSALLLAQTRPVAGFERVRTLAPLDMVLHSICHLMHNEEFSHGLRDLSDIDLLLREFGTLPGFWDGLVPRAHELDLSNVLAQALAEVARVFDTPVPSAAQREAAQAGPRGLAGRAMRALWARSLESWHPAAGIGGQRLAAIALQVRGHALKMPAGLLLRHLVHKTLFSRSDG